MSQHETTDDVVRWRRMALTRMERAAMREFKESVAAARHWGLKRIVSMQGLEEAGLVRRVSVNGMIADWKLTPEGEAWNG